MVYTVGYEGTDLQTFIDCLIDSGIERIADVRLIPFSRKRGFSKSPLQVALTESGIEYVHLREFGCPKLIRDAYKEDGDWDSYVVKYNAYLNLLSEPLARLLAMTEEKRTCLLCFEADPYRCHRLLIANRLQQIYPNVAVRNLHAVKRNVRTSQAGAQLSLL
jgi:uncharacterized protein (DUF488 family)